MTGRLVSAANGRVERVYEAMAGPSDSWPDLAGVG